VVLDLTRTLGLVAMLAGCVATEELGPLVRNEEHYGNCLDEDARTVCRDDEPFCDAYPDAQFPELNVCTGPCESEADCPAPATGDATVTCSGDPAGCVLECDEGEACPDGMECSPAGACMWRLD